LKLLVDIGYEKRTILSGIAAYYSAQEMIGKKVVVVANLKPRPMMGLESHGMILMSENREGKLVIVGTDNEAGSTVT
jgi:methionyl-tRNA synthetase